MRGVISLSPTETKLSDTLRSARLAARVSHGKRYSLRAVSARVGVSATYLSLIERGVQCPSEATLRAVAADLGLEVDALLSLSERVEPDVLAALRSRPALVEVVRALRNSDDASISRIVRHIRDGEW